MLFVKVLFVSLIVFVICRLLILYVPALLIKKLVNGTESPNKNSILLSFCLLLLFLSGFIKAVQAVNIVFWGYEQTLLDWYMIYILIGIACIVWCYFKWDLKLISLPKFNDNSKEVAAKKTIIFFLVFLFSLFYGYHQIQMILNHVEIDLGFTVINITVISVIIALDRVFSQLVSINKKN